MEMKPFSHLLMAFAATLPPSAYVLDEFGKCHNAQSAVTLDHCIYQKAFNKEPQGFTILAREGGVCRASHADSLEELTQELRSSLHVSDQNVPMSNCLDHTLSYGDVLAKRVQMEAERLPASTISQVQYTVQLSSHVKKEEAEARISAYKKRGIEAFYIEARVDGKTWYRVCSGKFATKKEAREFRRHLAHQKDFHSAFITRLKSL